MQRNILSEEGVICAANKKRRPGGSKGGGAHFEKKRKSPGFQRGEAPLIKKNKTMKEVR